ncbi:hypothetical protein C8Q70DRAFT_202633 [Cubamyces menziesii]|nr:hypothetical protein C8Q70DRAFT_202633 [Cubamyces menziesii]
MTEYIDGYRIPRRRHALTISHFLRRRAYDCYTTTVSSTHKTWSLHRIMVALFDYCFPIDFTCTPGPVPSARTYRLRGEQG